MSLKGSDFLVEGTTDTAHLVGDTLQLSNYFTATANFDLNSTATLFETMLEGQLANGASPIIGLRIVSTTGPYQDYPFTPQVVEGEQVLKNDLNLVPGNYQLIMAYHTDTAKGNRPRITLKQVDFKNPEAASNVTQP